MSSQAYQAGLLHDIGKLALAQNFEVAYQGAVKGAEQQGRPLFQVEKELLGATHAEAGAYLLAVWGLPLPILEAVAFHHDSSGVFANGFSPAAAVHLAEHLVEEGADVDELVLRYPPELGLRDHVEQLRRLAAPANHSDRAGAGRPGSDRRGSNREPNGEDPRRLEPAGGRVSKFFGGVARMLK
jgi:hypothetical protein